MFASTLNVASNAYSSEMFETWEFKFALAASDSGVASKWSTWKESKKGKGKKGESKEKEEEKMKQ